ncbi:PTS sugar transporter subunit IIA [Chitinispirillales bacterium ANBcel5]|uniref:PTS sugar transporter subunit IIA n=1 Tax=Cellulosispirillum alkaliphilum TaxID=3039283 RepID=UPI002A544968|nr:PTS sugar transporter subunit IIA [Chitinispirillales bacterium ANBcel5]
MSREDSMSTGMQYGITIPHAKTDAVTKISISFGLAKDGIDFKSLDGAPSTIFVMILSPVNVSGPHIQLLASLSALLNNAEARQRLLSCKTSNEIYWFFRKGLER